MRELYFW